MLTLREVNIFSADKGTELADFANELIAMRKMCRKPYIEGVFNSVLLKVSVASTVESIIDDYVKVISRKEAQKPTNSPSKLEELCSLIWTRNDVEFALKHHAVEPTEANIDRAIKKLGKPFCHEVFKQSFGVLSDLVTEEFEGAELQLRNGVEVCSHKL